MSISRALETRTRISSARSLLFVPGDRPDRIEKAFSSTADAVIVDLEDAVRPESKQSARSVVLKTRRGSEATSDALFLIRINAFRSADFAADVDIALTSGADGVVLPKFVPGTEALLVNDALCASEARHGAINELPLIGLVESAAGLRGLSVPQEFPARLLRLAFGAADFHADLRISYTPSGTYTDLAMAGLVIASAAAGLAEPLDSPHFSLGDDEGLLRRARRARELGFGGALCIHPRQVTTINTEFDFGSDERAWAESILAAWRAPSSSGHGAIRVGDELVDEAIVRRARQILQAGSSSGSPH